MRMLQIGILAALATASCQESVSRTADPPEEVATTYAESVAIGGMSLDAEEEFSVRLGRFPQRGLGTLWVSVFVGGKRYSVSDHELELGEVTGRTPVDEDAASFRVTGPAQALFTSTDRNSSRMIGSVHAEALTHEEDHPPPGRGTVPVEIDAEFVAAHDGFRMREGRLEVMGSVTATVTTPTGQYRLTVPGKWHEQTGDRPRFGPPFTYFNVRGTEVGLLAGTRPSGAWGFFRNGREVIEVEGFSIDPLGLPRRAFRAELANGQIIEGEANVKREGSVPIEGRRRPGATVIAETNVGAMAGHLNDWNPED